MAKRRIVGKDPRWCVPSIRVIGLNRGRGVVVTVRHVDWESKKKIISHLMEQIKAIAKNEGLELIVEGVDE